MGTLLNGIKEIFATSQSTATHVPVCASDGTPQGRISVGDLASVLGGLKYWGKPYNDDANNALQTGTYQGTGGQPNRAPITGGHLLVVIRGVGDYLTQFAVHTAFNNSQSVENGEVYTRAYIDRNGQFLWSNWFRVNLDIPSFYKNYNNLSSLASAIGGKTKGLFTRFDKYKNEGVTNVGGDLVENFVLTDRIIQRVTQTSDNGETIVCWTRTYSNSEASWGEPKMISVENN